MTAVGEISKADRSNDTEGDSRLKFPFGLRLTLATLPRSSIELC